MVHRSQILRGALFMAALLTCLAPQVGAATLEVIGPPGAEVVNGDEVLGVLPLSAPIELPHGQLFIIQVRKPGYSTHEEQVFLLSPETELRLEVDLLSLNRTTAMVSSALLAGTGQFYQGRRTTGAIHMGLQLVAWGSVIYGELQFQDKRDDYETLDQEYSEALIAEDIAQISEDRDTAWNEMEDAETWRNVSFGAVIVIAAWSVFDAWRGHNHFHASVESAADSPDGYTTARIGLSWGFGGGAR